MPELDLEKYYRKHSAEFGWGSEVASLNPERVELLDRYVEGPRVLDIACGSGIYTDYLSNQGYDAWGVDFVEEFILKARETKKGNFVQGDADKLPFADNEFDTVLLFDILEHGDDIAILREAKRVASKRILVNVPRKVDKELEEAGVVFRHYIDKTHLREYQYDDLYGLAEVEKLKLIDIFPVNNIDTIAVFRVLFHGNWMVLMIMKILCRLILRKKYYYTGYFVVFEIM